jgi:histidinol-phosphate/aromatic aminotransferase/cobyric acid decarboxylase-like protein/choline kinase
VGDRLRPLTDRLPKCLVPVNGVPILVNTLTHLADSGIRETVIVVGYLKEKILERIGDRFRGMKITYVESERYATTNNIYSLWLVREYLDEDILLLEADIYFERELLDSLLCARGENHAAVAHHQPWMSGTVVRLDEHDNIEAMVESRRQGPDFDYSNTFKTVNIYRLGDRFLREHFLPCLDATIASGKVHDYYETLLNELCSENGLTLAAVRCDAISWIEIDNQDDLTAANYMFASKEQRYEYISSLHGDYWRYDFIDHALLYNLYFPPEALLNNLSNHLRDLVLNYPSGQDVIAGLMGTLIDQPSERIIVGNGASELIKVIGRRLKRRLIVPVPSFNEWVNAVPEGLVTESVLEPSSFQLDVERFAREVVNCAADIAIVLNPNNPTSLAVPKADLTWLVEHLAARDILLIIDESFIDFMANTGEATMETETGCYRNLAIIKSLSKCYGIGGLRLGYLLTDNSQFASEVREEIPIWNSNAFAEAFLRLAPHYRTEFAHSCELVRFACNGLYRNLRTIPGLKAYRPDANFVLCRMPDDAMSGPELTRKLFIEDNILVKHCTGKTMPEADRYVRIASRTQAENQALTEALRRMIGISRTERTVSPSRS